MFGASLAALMTPADIVSTLLLFIAFFAVFKVRLSIGFVHDAS
jgi:Sec-independent protein secretion pathway component TatC